MRKVADEDAWLDAFAENVVRADLTVMEEAEAFQKMLDGGYSPKQISQEIGVQTWRVKYRLQLMALDPVDPRGTDGRQDHVAGRSRVGQVHRHRGAAAAVRDGDVWPAGRRDPGATRS